MSDFLTVAEQVAILFALMAVGAAMRKVRLLTDAAIDGMVNLLILIVTPCLIVDVFQRPFSPSMLKGLALAILISILCHCIAIAIACLAIRHRDENICSPMRLAVVFSNAGFMGIPLEQAVLGDAGVFYGAGYIAVFNLFMWSWGYRMMLGAQVSTTNQSVRDVREVRGSQKRSLQVYRMLINPGTVGIALGLPLFFMSVQLPEMVGTPVHLIAGLNTPLAMIVIGYYLFGAKLGRVAKMPIVYYAAAIRLVVYPLLTVAAMYPFRHHLDRSMMLAIVIAASAPVAAMVSMFAAKFKRDVDTSVAVVSGSTLLSILTMPPIIALAMSVL